MSSVPGANVQNSHKPDRGAEAAAPRRPTWLITTIAFALGIATGAGAVGLSGSTGSRAPMGSETGWATSIRQYLSSSELDSVRIAILDSGVVPHPALDGAVRLCVDLTTEIADPDSCLDESGHGTHLAGLIAGQASEFSGVIPEAELLVFKICDSAGVCSASSEVRALEWAQEVEADVVLIGLAGPQEDRLETEAVKRALQAGLIVVAPVGNLGELGAVGYPARLPGVVGVGAVDRNDVVAFFSAKGQVAHDLTVDIVAPGVSVLSTAERGSFEIRDGTSQAAAIVAGALGGLIAAGVESSEAVHCLTTSARDLTDPILDGIDRTGPDEYSGWGVLAGPFACLNQ